MPKYKLRPHLLTTMLLAGFACGPATAQDLSSSISCLKGIVAPNDYAELGEKLRETQWDNKGGVNILAQISGLKLRIYDPSGNSVCQETANNSTSCTFKVDLAEFEEFNVVVDNVDVDRENSYLLCAF